MKSTQFIEGDDVVYLPRPTSVNAGQARSIWVKRCLNKASHITSPEYWDLLAKFHPIKNLVENEDGFFVLVDSHPTTCGWHKDWHNCDCGAFDKNPTKWYDCPRCDAGYEDQDCTCEVSNEKGSM